MFKVLRQWSIVLLSAFVWATSVYGDTIDKQPKLEQLLQKSGVTEQILEFPNAMKFSIDQIHKLGQCTDESFNAINEAIDANIITASMHDLVIQELMSNISEAEIDLLLQWYNSTTGQKISMLENQASTPEAYEEMRQSSSRLFSNKKQLAQAQQIDKILHASEWAVNVQMQSTIAMLGSLAEIQHKDITNSLIKLASQLDQQKALLKPQVEKSITLWYLYTYQSLSNSEMTAYQDFLKSQNAQKFNQKSLSILAHAITKVVEDFIISVETTSIEKRQENTTKDSTAPY